jgi:plasmid stability protein
MEQIVVRNLERSVKQGLKRRAARHGHSMEEEVREILRNAVNEKPEPEEGLGTAIAKRFKGLGLKKEEIPELRGYTIEPPSFDE